MNRSRELLKAIFFATKKKKKNKAYRFCLKFSSNFNTSVQRCLYHLFQNQSPHFFFFCFIFFEECLNPQFMINKTANEHTVDYHPSPSELTSWINLLIFRWTPKRFISLEYFLNFFSKLYIPPWLRKSFKFNNH